MAIKITVEDRWNIKRKQIDATRSKINALRRNLTKLMKAERDLREKVLDEWRSYAKGES